MSIERSDEAVLRARAAHPLGGVSLPPAVLRALPQLIRENPGALLHLPAVRSAVARVRHAALVEGRDISKHQGDQSGVRDNTLEYNASRLGDLVGFDRPSVLVEPLRALTSMRRPAELHALSIGPRTEIELLSLLSAGFALDRIRAVDLFSYSPLIETGDMHELQYPDGRFDVVLAGWVLAYSKEPGLAVAEMVRVCRDGGVVAIGCDYEPGEDSGEYRAPGAPLGGAAPIFRSADDILQWFPEGSIGRVVFRADAEPPYDNLARRNIVHVRLAKPGGVRIRAGAGAGAGAAAAAPRSDEWRLDLGGPVLVTATDAGAAGRVQDCAAAAPGAWAVRAVGSSGAAACLVVGPPGDPAVQAARAAGVPTVPLDTAAVGRALREIWIERQGRALLAPLSRRADLAPLLEVFHAQRARHLVDRRDAQGQRVLRPLYVHTQGVVNEVYRKLHAKAFPPRMPSVVEGALGRVDAERRAWARATLDRDGFLVWPTPLAAETVARLRGFGETAPALARNTLHDDAPVPNYPGPGGEAKKYLIDQQVLLGSPDVRDLLFDPSVRAVAEAALGCEPVQDMFAMWWSTARTGDTPEAEHRARSEAAQLHHFDMDRLGFIKMFVYLTDVTPETGPHALVRGSHRQRPASLWRDGRIGDAEVAAAYPAEDQRALCGPAGTILWVDTRVFHKGTPLLRGQRLLFQIEFSTDLWGAPWAPLVLPAAASESHAAQVRAEPRVYERYAVAP